MEKVQNLKAEIYDLIMEQAQAQMAIQERAKLIMAKQAELKKLMEGKGNE